MESLHSYQGDDGLYTGADGGYPGAGDPGADRAYIAADGGYQDNDDAGYPGAGEGYPGAGTGIYQAHYNSDIYPYMYSDYGDTNLTSIGGNDRYAVNVGAKVVLSLSYTLMIIICGTGNMLLCCVIYRFKRMRTVTNLLIANLALSDFMVAAVVAPFNFYYYLHNTWPFGKVMCVLVGYIKAVSLYVSVNSLLIIAVDRYLTIMNPLRPRMTHSTTLTILVLIWIVSAAVATPTAVYSDIYLMERSDGKRMTQCAEVQWGSGRAMKANTLFLVIGEFIFPLLLMSIIYFLIARRLWFRQVPCDHLTERQEAAAEASKRRTIRMLIIVVGLFAVCWAPYHSFSIARDFFLQTRQDSLYKTITTAFYMVEALAMSNSLFNTLIYIFFNANFRKCVFQLLTSSHRTNSYQSTVRVRYSRPTQVVKPSSNNYDASQSQTDHNRYDSDPTSNGNS